MQLRALTCGAMIAPRVRGGVARIGLGLSSVQARLAILRTGQASLACLVSWSQQEISRSKQCNGEGMDGH